MKLEIKGRHGKRSSIPCEAKVDCQLAISRITDASRVIIHLDALPIYDKGYPVIALIMSYAEAEKLSASLEHAIVHAIESSERAAIQRDCQ